MRRLTAAALLSALLSWACASPDLGKPRMATAAAALVSAGATCAELGYGSFGARIAPVVSGTYPLDAAQGGANTVTLTVDPAGLFFDWTTTLSVDAVIVQGGPAAHAYTYLYEAVAASGASAPVEWETGRPYPLGAIELCYDYELQVSTTAQPRLARQYQWEIHYSSPVTTATLAVGEGRDFPYEVGVSVTGITDGGPRMLGGTVSIHNPAPLAATLTAVLDHAGAQPMPLGCGVTFPYVLAAGQTLSCTYEATLSGVLTGLNEVDVHTSGVVGGGTASMAFDFSQASIEWLDYHVRVYGVGVGGLGGDAWASSAPTSFPGIASLGPYASCGLYNYPGEAWFEATDTRTYKRIRWNTQVTVPCCTHGLGYWKNHSSYGPAAYDETWGRLTAAGGTLTGLGADTPFFLSGQSYLEVLRTPPRGNGYYLLAHAYIPAELNRFAGSLPGLVRTAFERATAIFERYTPAQLAALKGLAGALLRLQLIAYAAALDAYNSGLIGPGLCSE